MAVTQTTRMLQTRWSAGGDAFTRSQMDDDHLQIETRAAGRLRGLAADRPAASAIVEDFLYQATDTAELSWCNGSSWVTIPTGFAAPDPIEPDDTQDAGSAFSAARSDHRHAIATAAPVAIGTALAEGDDTTFARSDHVHELGTGAIDGIAQFAASLRPYTVCTSATRPGSPSEGDSIFETDTDRRYFFNGSDWIYAGGGISPYTIRAARAASWTSVTSESDFGFDTLVFGSATFFNVASGVYTAPVAGVYRVFWQLSIVAQGAGEWINAPLHKAGAQYSMARGGVSAVSGNVIGAQGSDLVSLTAGQTLKIRTAASHASRNGGTGGDSWLAIEHAA